jgi:hypothetical protein
MAGLLKLEFREIVVMTKFAGILILLGTIAGCTSMDTGQTGSLTPTGSSPGTSCNGNPWSWCVGYHGRG